MKRFALLAIFILILSGCKEQIVHNLTEEDANRYLAHLHSGSFAAEKIRLPDSSWAIAVPDSQAVSAIQYLTQARLVRRSRPETGESRSLIASREEERFRFERAMSKEVESTLTTIDGVLEARVHLHLPPRDPLFGKSIDSGFTSTASVLLITSGEFPIAVSEIQRLVSGAAGVPLEGVTVLTSNASDDSLQTGGGAIIEAPERGLNWSTLLAPIAAFFFLTGAILLFGGKFRDYLRKPRLQLSKG